VDPSMLQDVLKPDELEALMATTHRPNFVLSVISRTIDEAQLPTMARLRCDENLTNFADVCGGCERILKTPIPLSYTRC
jgi:putative membrane protein